MFWGGFRQAAPSLAARVHEEIGRFGFVLVGTVRRDGTPKARDLDRDSRVLLRMPVTNPAHPECDVQLLGHVLHVDEAQRKATADAVETTSGWRPRDTWRYFTVAISAASCIEWSEDEMRLTRWDQVRGLQPTERRRLDMEGSQYLPADG